MTEKRCPGLYMYMYKQEFEDFWLHFPRKQAKLAAMTAYAKARRLVSASEILAGVEALKTHLPEDKRFIPLPSTFLNQGRWMDEYEPAKPTAPDWFLECQTVHQGTCLGSVAHQTAMLLRKQS